MICNGCYKKSTDDYCLFCRKKLFNGAKVSAVLPFNAPTADNILLFQDYSKRLSISGMQLKYSLRLNGNKLELCENGAQFMLKPIPVAKQLLELGNVPANEHLTMQIAEQVFKIKTAANGLIYFKDGQPAYITKRFDVKPDSGKYLQEDFAQLTNKTKETNGETYKYEGSYEEIGTLIKKFVAASMPALEIFFQLVVFNYIISNGDAHLKNFSLIRDNFGEYQLTPAYDLMSTVIHTPMEADTALDLYKGGMDSPYYSAYGHYGRADFLELAQRLGLVTTRAEKILNGFLKKKEQVRNLIDQSFLSEKVKKIYFTNMEDKMRRIEV